ncbi:MAG TPA: type I methionyl aminopeptidase [Gaiellales bacterium]|nr:type I methionyl aminopeptidase [Gaiellales bacterium]
MIIRKTAGEVDTMARAGVVVAGTLDLLEQEAKPGVTLAELDRLAEEYITGHGGVPSFKGYRGFPGSICASPNEMVVHGIPGPYVLADGDLLSLDVGVTLDGYVADSAITVVVGTPAAEALDLIDACYEGLEAAIGQCRAGNRLGDVSHAVQEAVEARGYGVVRSLVGHGVGRDMHEDPQIPNYGPPGRGPRLAPGMVFAIEPMITAGSYDVEGGSDGWAVFTRDGSLAAHCEHTVAITDNGPRVLTRRDAPKQDCHAQ